MHHHRWSETWHFASPVSLLSSSEMGLEFRLLKYCTCSGLGGHYMVYKSVPDTFLDGQVLPGGNLVPELSMIAGLDTVTFSFQARHTSCDVFSFASNSISKGQFHCELGGTHHDSPTSRLFPGNNQCSSHPCGILAAEVQLHHEHVFGFCRCRTRQQICCIILNKNGSTAPALFP